MGIKVSLVPSSSGVKILGIVNVFSSHSLSTKTESFAEHSNSLVLVTLTHPVSEMLVVFCQVSAPHFDRIVSQMLSILLENASCSQVFQLFFRI